QRDALAAVGEFAGELSHEVRNPLTALRLDLQRVDEVAGDPSSVRAIANRALRQIDRMDRAVTGALRIVRSGSVEPAGVDLAEVLEHARRTADAEFAQRSVTLMVHASPGVELSGDAAALEQAFLNLLINAAQASAAGGMTMVTTT